MSKIFEMFSGNKKDSLSTKQDLAQATNHTVKTYTGLDSSNNNNAIYNYGYTCSLCGVYVTSGLAHVCYGANNLHTNLYTYDYTEYRRLLAQTESINNKLEATIEKFDQTVTRFAEVMELLLKNQTKKKATKKRA